MCQLIINADSDLWKRRTKSLCIDGVSTSMRSENFFRATLEEIAACDRMTVNQLITKFYYESIDAEHDLGYFSSFLRICCTRYHSSMGKDEFSPSLDEESGNLAADGIFEREKVHYRLIGQWRFFL